MTLYQRICILFATGFGLGYSPIASGTVGCLLGIPLTFLLWECPSWVGRITACIVLALLAIPICDVTEKKFGKKDDGRIVADEYMTFPICMLGLPLDPFMLVIAFLSNRFFDITKPPPARRLQAIGGGTGVVIDDVLAAIYSLIFNHLAWWTLHHFNLWP